METVVDRVGPSRAGVGSPAPSVASVLDLLEAGGRALLDEPTLGRALDGLAAALASAVRAELVTIRVLDPETDRLRADVVASSSAALAAALERTSFPADELPLEATDERGSLPPPVRSAAGRLGAGAILLVPIRLDGVPAASLELVRGQPAFDAVERRIARAAGDGISSVLRRFRLELSDGDEAEHGRLELAGEALAAGSDETRTAAEVVRVAAEVTGACTVVLWRRGADGLPLPVASFPGGADTPPPKELDRLRVLAEQALPGGTAEAAPAVGAVDTVTTLPLGRPARWALQLVAAPEASVTGERLRGLTRFGVRAAHALAAGERARTLDLELERTQALLAVVAQASSELSLSHTLETVVARVSELFGTERVGVYLQEGGRLSAAAVGTLNGPHELVAERLLELALGPFRGDGLVLVRNAALDWRLLGLGRALEDAGIEAIVAVPLVLPDEATGLLAVYPPRGRSLTENESALLIALAGRLAVAVQNARLHERATALGAELEGALAAERQAARQLGALYEISRSFTQDVSLEATLEVVARAVVDLLGIDAALVRMPDERGELLEPKAVHVADERVREAIELLLARSQPLAKLPGRRLFRMGKAFVLDPETAAATGPAHEALAPFLEAGGSAAVLPIATPTELLGTLTLLSLDRERPISEEMGAVGSSLAAQAALALVHARLLGQQRRFAESMQRSLLPRSRPEVSGLEIGEVYESAAAVEVGGDVYDFLVLEDGRLAVVVGDVAGHGIDAAADMAMAKFVFRSLAREHPEPGDFLRAANEVVCDEIEPGKFITMVYVTIALDRSSLSAASAGHPAPRLVLPDGTVRELPVGGLALGIQEEQDYGESSVELPPGASVVLFTDGVIEARRDGELWGFERLDRVLAERRDLPPAELARAVLDACRAFGGGELDDDCALVVIKRT
ncbi:MAG: SpoIIE family protein phosphatase [Actinobacteria bacterium]|nr:SpoIIE family protein phosphatase [Actinomycetota bacterium]